MARKSPQSEAWFLPKRYGYGAGLPFVWQGWVLLIFYLAATVGLGLWAKRGGRAWVAVCGVIVVTAVFVPLVRRHTRGKWRWRWGRRD